MAEEAEAAPADAERRPSALDKLKKASHLAAVVSTVRSSVHKGGPAAAAGRGRRGSEPRTSGTCSSKAASSVGRLRSAAPARVTGHSRLASHAGREGFVRLGARFRDGRCALPAVQPA